MMSNFIKIWRSAATLYQSSRVNYFEYIVLPWLHISE